LKLPHVLKADQVHDLEVHAELFLDRQDDPRMAEGVAAWCASLRPSMSTRDRLYPSMISLVS